MVKMKPSFIWGVFISITFLFLLAIRLQFFSNNNQITAGIKKTPIQRPAETWMNIYQKNEKIGVVHRQFKILETGKIQTQEKITMQITTLGITQVIHLAMETELKPDMSFSSFNFDLNSGLFRFNAHGYVGQNKLILFTGTPSTQQKSEIPLKEIPYISGNIYEAAFASVMEKNVTRAFTIFDPSTIGIHKIKLTRESDEIIPIMGKRVLTQKFCADFMGAKHCAWLDKNGEVLKETGLLGLSMEKVSPERAAGELIKNRSVDFTQLASITSNIQINHPNQLKEMKVKIDGIRNSFLVLQGGRQNFRQSVLTIIKETVPDNPVQKKEKLDSLQKYTRPSILIQSDHAEIKTQLRKVVHPSDSVLQKTKKIINWVYININKRPVLSVPNALEVLRNKEGDCNEHAVLTTALLRAAGIPTQIETGLIYQNGHFYYHAWNIVYIEKWITVDSVFNQIPADVTHIRLARGEHSEQINLLEAMGKIKLEVLTIK